MFKPCLHNSGQNHKTKINTLKMWQVQIFGGDINIKIAFMKKLRVDA